MPVKNQNVTKDGLKIDKSGKEYVSNPLLLQEIIKSQEQGELTPNALKMLMLMVTQIQRKRVYKNKEDEKDCAATAYLDIALYWKGFNPEKSNNPFAYYTSIITNALAKGWDKAHPECKKAPDAIFTSLDNNIHSL